MKKGGKRVQRDSDDGTAPRRRTESDKAPGAARAAPVEEEEEVAPMDSSDEEWEDEGDVVIEDEEEEIVEEDDDEYAEFQKESVEALSKGLKSVTFADVPGEEETEDGAANLTVWRGDQEEAVEGDGPLQYSNKAYDSFFQLRTEYPCLSFDVVKDNDGTVRAKYPLSMVLVCGSQADENSKNQLVVLRISNICRTKHDVESDEDSEDSYIGDGGDSEEDEDEEEEEVNDGEPIVNHRVISHYGTANRVRFSPHANRFSANQFVAVWSDAGHVQVFDLENDVRALTDFANWSKEQAKAARDGKGTKKNPLKFCTPSSSHKTEGYGLDWSPVQANVFASGDCNGALYVWQPSDDGRWKNAASSTVEGAMSVEEIQWSPTQADVLISARAGGAVEVWDTRDMRSCKLSWRADPTDINVADWNRVRQASHLLATGAESGAVAIWDLRKLAATEPIQRLSWHKKSITSVEFSLHNESVLSVTSDDGQCTLWDLSVERDPSEEQEVIGELFGRRDLTDIPDQLMFQHQGLSHPKEGHWHSQIPGMMITTDFEGLHLFRPMNWRSLMH